MTDLVKRLHKNVDCTYNTWRDLGSRTSSRLIQGQDSEALHGMLAAYKNLNHFAIVNCFGSPAACTMLTYPCRKNQLKVPDVFHDRIVTEKSIYQSLVILVQFNQMLIYLHAVSLLSSIFIFFIGVYEP